MRARALRHARPSRVALLATLPLVASACSGTDAATSQAAAWHSAGLNAVSKTSTAGGITVVTAMGTDGALETTALESASGKRLWSYPAAMAGRLPGMGVQPPATVSAKGKTVVAALDPGKKGKKWKATLVGRDARSGKLLWSRPVHSTFGPQRCGDRLCLSEHTALKKARFVALDPLSGDVTWKTPGIGEVQWGDESNVVLLRLAKVPTLESRDLRRKGKVTWSTPLSKALGENVVLSAGWSFGTVGDHLVGYVAPFNDAKRRTSFGMFSIRLSDGGVEWMRPGIVRVYPSGNPAAGMVARPVDGEGRYGGFAHINGETGKVTGQIAAGQIPGTGWWLAFSEDGRRLGFLRKGATGEVFDLPKGERVEAAEQTGWSFCVRDPQELKIKNVPDFYPVAALCQFDLATGNRLSTTDAPPVWYTGRQDGWRIWRDEKGILHGTKDGSGDSPGMYG